jgi:diguanylate cyclase (GGDEF)-like protein
MCEDIEKCDKLLKVITETLNSSIKRTTDFIARWSDDEIVALLPITGEDGATIVAERIYNELGGKSLPGIDEKASVSIGVGVHIPEPGERPADFINNTFNALIKAQEAEGSKIVYS